MAKTHVKLKDTTGSFFVPSQGISISRNQIVEVESDSVIAEAIQKGALIECDQDDFDAYVSERQAAIDALKPAATAAPTAPATAPFDAAAAKALATAALTKGSAIVNANKTISFGKVSFDDQDEFEFELLSDPTLQAQVQATV